MTRHTPPKEIPTPGTSPISEITPPDTVFYDFKQGIETIIKFIDLDLNDGEVEEHIKQDLRVLRAVIVAVNFSYPFTQDQHNTLTNIRKHNRLTALINLIQEISNIHCNDLCCKYDQPRA